MEKTGVESYFVVESETTSGSGLFLNEGLGGNAPKLAGSDDCRMITFPPETYAVSCFVLATN